MSVDINRTALWNQWRNYVFDRLDEALGEAGSKGAMRFYGDFQVNIDAAESGNAHLWVTANPNAPMPSLGLQEKCVEWEQTDALAAAEAILGFVEKFRGHPEYIIAKGHRDL